MAFKTSGFKTKYIEEYGYIHNEYTIYCAVESVSDVCVYKMFGNDGNEKEINISAEDDTDGYGNRSLIDCLFYLKQHEDKHYQNKDWDIIIERMSNEEMNTIYGSLTL